MINQPSRPKHAELMDLLSKLPQLLSGLESPEKEAEECGMDKAGPGKLVIMMLTPHKVKPGDLDLDADEDEDKESEDDLDEVINGKA